MLNGTCAPQFEAVRQEFERNFSERSEVGAAVSITLDGETVVDLWGGVADPATGSAWDRDTVTTVFSSTKGIAAICAHVCIDRGLLDVNAPVAHYWPEFAAAGKADIPVRLLLSHQAGLPMWEQDVPAGGLYDWEWATAALAAQAPAWHPGAAQGYHPITIGFLVGELVRRVSGLTVGTFLQKEVAGPLGADAWIGLPEEIEPRVAPVTMFDHTQSADVPLLGRIAGADLEHFRSRAFLNEGGYLHGEYNSRAAHEAEIPAVNGITNARGLARLYAPLALDGSVDGIRVVRSESLPLMRHPQAVAAFDQVFTTHSAYTVGFSKSWDNRHLDEPGVSVIFGESAFGTPGGGGSIGFADPQARMSFGYVMNSHGPNTGLNERGQSLVDTAYRCAGFRTSEPGSWVR